MTFKVEIGGTPAEEACAATGKTVDYDMYNRLECRAYIAALKVAYGPPPEGGEFRVKGNPHDFGTYYDVEYRCPDDNAEAVAYGFKVENGLSSWLQVNFWPPVTYDRQCQPVHVISDLAMLDREKNPACFGDKQTLPAPVPD